MRETCFISFTIAEWVAHSHVLGSQLPPVPRALRRHSEELYRAWHLRGLLHPYNCSSFFDADIALKLYFLAWAYFLPLVDAGKVLLSYLSSMVSSFPKEVQSFLSLFANVAFVGKDENNLHDLITWPHSDCIILGLLYRAIAGRVWTDRRWAPLSKYLVSTWCQVIMEIKIRFGNM